MPIGVIDVIYCVCLGDVFIASIIIAGVVRKPLNCIFVCGNVHNGNAGDLADTAFQVLVASGNDVALVHITLVDEAVVGVAQA